MKIETKIYSKNLIIQNLNRQDLNQRYLSWLKDKKVNQYLDQDKDYKILKLKDCIILHKYLQKSHNNFFLKIIKKSNNLHLGNIRVGEVFWDEKISEIAILIGEKNIGVRVTVQRQLWLLQISFLKIYPLDFFLAGFMAKNTSSDKLFSKCEFKKKFYSNKFSKKQEKIINFVKKKLKSNEILTIKER